MFDVVLSLFTRVSGMEQDKVVDSFGIIREGQCRVGSPDCIARRVNKSSPHYRRVAINSTEEKTEVTFLYKVPSRLRRYTLTH
jgi:hypothetical protein